MSAKFNQNYTSGKINRFNCNKRICKRYILIENFNFELMKQFKRIIPQYLRILLIRLSIPMVLLSLTRILFYLFNSTKFNDVSITDFLAGVWFDAITVALYFLPYVVIYLFPIPIRGYKLHKIVLKTYFIIATALLVGLNLMDIEYFNYTSKRSTFDIFTILGAGSDFAQLITTFIGDFWYLIVIFLVFLIVLWKLYTKTGSTDETFKHKPTYFYRTNSIFFVITLALMIVVGRGGFGLKPVDILEASNFTKSGNTALVLNTPFSMIKSYGQIPLEEYEYYASIKESEKYFNPNKTSKPANLLPDKTNVVIIILESFGNEFIGFNNGGNESYTPFLDSLMAQSLTYEYGFANGKKSIEAVPSIFASMPTLMDNPYISSVYNGNKIVGLPELLSRHGYETAFYHGATNGSMHFDAFAKNIGFDHYFGRTEYGNEKHADKTWGILDEYFEPWSARKMSELKEPFMASIFTLSSHHPYFIPEHMRKKVKNGPQLICASISYGDIALRLFFEEAKKQKWYDNTVFILCADHTPSSVTPLYNQRTQMYQIPIAIYHPGGKIIPEKKEGIIKQLDIYPTVLDLLNIKDDFYSYGNSIFQTNKNQSFNYLEGTYYYFENGKMLTFSNNEARNLYDFTIRNNSLVDSISYFGPEVKEYEKTLKAIIQRYNHDLIRNQTANE